MDCLEVGTGRLAGAQPGPLSGAVDSGLEGLGSMCFGCATRLPARPRPRRRWVCWYPRRFAARSPLKGLRGGVSGGRPPARRLGPPSLGMGTAGPAVRPWIRATGRIRVLFTIPEQGA
jgi:hypothetical protein